MFSTWLAAHAILPRAPRHNIASALRLASLLPSIYRCVVDTKRAQQAAGHYAASHRAATMQGDPRHLTFDTISRPVRPSGRALVGSEPEPATVFPLQRRGAVRSLRAGKDAEQQASPLKEGDQGETPSLASPLPYHQQPSSLQCSNAGRLWAHADRI